MNEIFARYRDDIEIILALEERLQRVVLTTHCVAIVVFMIMLTVQSDDEGDATKVMTKKTFRMMMTRTNHLMSCLRKKICVNILKPYLNAWKPN
jgi:hypothetical protein